MPATTPRSTPYNRALRRGGLVAAIVFLAGSALYLPPVAAWLGEAAVLAILGVSRVLMALTSVALGIMLWRHFTPGETLRTICGSLAVGLFLWTLAEIIWAYDLAVLGQPVSTLSIADIASLGGYVPVLIALVLRYRSFRITPREPWQFAVLVGFALVALLSLLYVVAPIMQDTASSSLLERLVNGSYVIADLAIGFWALMMVLVLSGGMLSTPWLFVAFGCLAAVAGDLLYAFAERNLVYQLDPLAGFDLVGYLINILFLAAYALMNLGLYHQARLQNAL